LLQPIKRILLYGNLFAGLCAASLCVETNIQHNIPRNGWPFYFLVFATTAFYYTYVYVKSVSPYNQDDRITWYNKYLGIIKKMLVVTAVLIAVDAAYLVFQYAGSFKALTDFKWGLIALFPLVAFAYNFQILPFPKLRKLRRIGWMKPFVLGFIWSGLVTVYPVIFWQIQIKAQAESFALPAGWLWLQNFFFITALCILFDIKDYSIDMRHRIRTIPIQIGIEKTIQYAVLPLLLLSGMSMAMFYLNRYQVWWPAAFQIIPLAMTYFIGKGLTKTKHITYYLFAIDGLMIIKALVGIVGIYLYLN
jgi:4-hydroxybenzoate polyprenyltransferase